MEDDYIKVPASAVGTDGCQLFTKERQCRIDLNASPSSSHAPRPVSPLEDKEISLFISQGLSSTGGGLGHSTRNRLKADVAKVQVAGCGLGRSHTRRKSKAIKAQYSKEVFTVGSGVNLDRTASLSARALVGKLEHTRVSMESLKGWTVEH